MAHSNIQLEDRPVIIWLILNFIFLLECLGRKVDQLQGNLQTLINEELYQLACINTINNQSATISKGVLRVYPN